MGRCPPRVDDSILRDGYLVSRVVANTKCRVNEAFHKGPGEMPDLPHARSRRPAVAGRRTTGATKSHCFTQEIRGARSAVAALGTGYARKLVRVLERRQAIGSIRGEVAKYGGRTCGKRGWRGGPRRAFGRSLKFESNALKMQAIGSTRPSSGCATFSSRCLPRGAANSAQPLRESALDRSRAPRRRPVRE